MPFSVIPRQSLLSEMKKQRKPREKRYPQELLSSTTLDRGLNAGTLLTVFSRTKTSRPFAGILAGSNG